MIEFKPIRTLSTEKRSEVYEQALGEIFIDNRRCRQCADCTECVFLGIGFEVEGTVQYTLHRTGDTIFVRNDVKKHVFFLIEQRPVSCRLECPSAWLEVRRASCHAAPSPIDTPHRDA